MNKIREYILVKDEHDHPVLEQVGYHACCGDLRYTDDIYNTLSETFKMRRLITESFYVIAFDLAKKPKGICRVGQGDAYETPASLQNIFTFLLLVGANSFVCSHNHITDLPQPSVNDKLVTEALRGMSKMFKIEFVGHMIVNPEGYIIQGGTQNGTSRKLDRHGDLVDYDYEEECYIDNGGDDEFDYECEEECEYDGVDYDDEDQEEQEDCDSAEYQCAVVRDGFEVFYAVDDAMKKGDLSGLWKED